MKRIAVLGIAAVLSAAAWAQQGGTMMQDSPRPMMCGGGQPMAGQGGQQQQTGMGCQCPMMAMMGRMGQGMMQPPMMQPQQPGSQAPDSGSGQTR